MRYFPAALERLTEQFARLPGIGGKTAQRLAFHVLSLPKEDAEHFAQAILDARASHSDCTLADLYDPLTMPPDLRAAHAANDRAVLAAYGLAPDTPEPEIVAHLFKLYAEKVKEMK